MDSQGSFRTLVIQVIFLLSLIHFTFLALDKILNKFGNKFRNKGLSLTTLKMATNVSFLY